jgi:alpha-galactosidase
MKCMMIAAVVGLMFGFTSPAESKPVKVFILAGQSNMVGHGKVEEGRDPATGKKEVEGGLGSLRYFVRQHEDQYGARGKTPLVDGAGKWLVRDDVYIHCTADQEKKKGRLTVGFGAGVWFGPEFGFGHVVGNAIEAPVLIIKTSWGGKSLGVDFRPPSSGPAPEIYKAQDPNTVGQYYRTMIATVKEVLANLGKEFPELAGYTPEIAGFGWHQGWNDGCNKDMTDEYEKNMANFIKDVRKELGVEHLPFVIANTGMNGRGEKANAGTFGKLCAAQLAIGDPGKHPEFAGTVASVETRDFARPAEQSPSNFGYHWNHNGESHLLVGEAMGQAMVKLLRK